jgi:hypothetical protein
MNNDEHLTTPNTYANVAEVDVGLQHFQRTVLRITEIQHLCEATTHTSAVEEAATHPATHASPIAYHPAAHRRA